MFSLANAIDIASPKTTSCQRPASDHHPWIQSPDSNANFKTPRKEEGYRVIKFDGIRFTAEFGLDDSNGVPKTHEMAAGSFFHVLRTTIMSSLPGIRRHPSLFLDIWQ
jgi:hypothetical protein